MDLQSNCSLATPTFQSIQADSSFGIITIRQSTVIMREITASFVSTSLLSAVLSSIALDSNHFTDIGQISSPRFDGGVMNGLQMLHVYVSNCSFTRVYARNGGAIYLSYSNPNKATLLRV
jgi:hypothetical protein